MVRVSIRRGKPLEPRRGRDDEPLARARAAATRNEPDVELVAECADGASALATLEATDVDLLVSSADAQRDGFDSRAQARRGAAGGHLRHASGARAPGFDADAVNTCSSRSIPSAFTGELGRARRRIDPSAKLVVPGARCAKATACASATREID